MEISYLENRDRIYHHFFLRDSFYHYQFIFLLDSVFFFETSFKVFSSFFINLSNVSCNFFQGFSKFYPKVEVQNFANSACFLHFFLKSKVKFIFKIEVGESGVDFKKYRVEVGSRESISKNLESKSGVGSRFEKI